MENMKADLPAETRTIMDKYSELGDYDNPEFQNAMLVFYKKHFCRLDEWPKELLYSLEHVSRDVALAMNGPTEFDIIGNIRYWDVTRLLARISVPTLVTCGKYDEVSPKVARSIHRGIKGSRLVQFSKSSHMAMWEEREKFMNTVAKFLNTIN
jgi:proline iminopeptidase